MKIARIAICGGHLAPALALIEKLQQKGHSLFYIGRKKALEGDNSLSLEFLTVKKLKVPFYPIYCGRLQRSFTLYTIPSFLKFPLSLISAATILVKIKPQIVISFGGYVALPICLVAWILGIPIITHEQTHILGLSNRIICHLAKITCLSWPKTDNVPRNVKTVVTGNPVRESIISTSDSKRHNFGDKNLPLLYITGGSLGSRSINSVVAKVIPALVKHFRIIHQCGSADDQADLKILSAIRESLPAEYKKNYQVMAQVDVSDVGGIYRDATLIISRSGANTISELAFVGKPAILIPLPWSASNEQEYNARKLEETGSAIIIRQDRFGPEKIMEAIETIMKNYSFYTTHAQQATKLIVPDATSKILRLMEKHL